MKTFVNALPPSSNVSEIHRGSALKKKRPTAACQVAARASG